MNVTSNAKKTISRQLKNINVDVNSKKHTKGVIFSLQKRTKNDPVQASLTLLTGIRKSKHKYTKLQHVTFTLRHKACQFI